MNVKETKLIVLMALFLLLPPPLHAQTQTPFYQKKTIQVLIGSAPGGLYDRWGRLFAQHMGKYIPAI
jgi:tripartite-type tricarboxylate transporter receptor subunit TctC